MLKRSVLKSGPLEGARLANQILGFMIPDCREAIKKFIALNASRGALFSLEIKSPFTMQFLHISPG